MKAAEAGGRLDAFRNPGFPSYSAALVSTGFAVQIQTVAVGWQVYDLTGDPLDLGLVGLSQFLPRDPSRRRDRSRLRPLSPSRDHGGLPPRDVARRPRSHADDVARRPARRVRPSGFWRSSARRGRSTTPPRQSILPILVCAENSFPAPSPCSRASTSSPRSAARWRGGILYAASPLAAYGASFRALRRRGGRHRAHPALAPEHRPRSPGHDRGAQVRGLRYHLGQQGGSGGASLSTSSRSFSAGRSRFFRSTASDILDIGPTGLGVLRAGGPI